MNSTTTMAVTSKQFSAIIAKRGKTLLSMVSYLDQQHQQQLILKRPFLGELLSQAKQLEELLDAYNARNNKQWYTFRSLNAALKLFANVGYELLHIQHTLTSYKLLPIKLDFNTDTARTLKFVGDTLLHISHHIVDESRQLGLDIHAEQYHLDFYTEQPIDGQLPHDRLVRKKANVRETVTMLATAFLNLAAESNLATFDSKVPSEQYKNYIPKIFGEKDLRVLELRFHNLQSLYDTYVSETETETVDTDLPILRGHVTVVFHLLRTATDFAHYYERHLSTSAEQICCDNEGPLIDTRELLATLLNYSIIYSNLYLENAIRLCHSMLKRYAEPGQIELPIPRYRGFHVRPSTLIASLVHHYGSEVQMLLDGEYYDAGTPLDLFRANEKINAQKRRWLAEEILKQNVICKKSANEDTATAARKIVLTLAEQGKVILYQQPLQIPEQLETNGNTLLEQATGQIAQLLAMGRIDIDIHINAIFCGDKRVLEDIKLLAENGYGEDNFGNNVPLPKELEFLRK